MGMSASQARLLTLTARMSDLEYSAQQISNSKLRLAVQTEDVSRKYSDALNKERLSVLTGYNNSTSTYSDLSYSNLCGPDSPLLDQYGLATNAGAILVSKSIADTFKGSSDLNDFLVKMGEASEAFTDGYTKADFTKAQDAVAVSQPAYESAQTATAVALKNLNAYGSEHVKGYDTAGTWSYATTTTSTQSTIGKYKITTQTATAIKNSYDTALNAFQSNGDASDAELKAISDSYKQAYTELDATNKAEYPSATAPTPYTTTLNQLKELSDAILNQSVNSLSDGDLLDGDYHNGGSRISINSADLIAELFPAGATSSTTNVTKTELFNSKDNADKIQYMVPTSEAAKGITEADVKAKYDGLKSTYDQAVNAEATAKSTYEADAKALEDSAPQYNYDGANVDYYTNLFNRMCDGYATVENEDKTMNNSDWLQNQIMNGNLRLEKVNSNGEWDKISYKTDTSIQQESDDRDMAKAEAEYGIATAEIETKDKRFDLQLKNIETEHTAVQTEVDSVKKVIDKNIDRTFKMFNA